MGGINTRPIIVIDDDPDDLDMFISACKELGINNNIITFTDGLEFLDYIKTTEQKSFFILCDINMAKCSGLELKRIIHADESLRPKCIPFLLWSTSGASPLIIEAYSYNVQGFFVKPAEYEQLKDVVQAIVKYWGYSENPNSQ